MSDGELESIYIKIYELLGYQICWKEIFQNRTDTDLNKISCTVNKSKIKRSV